MIPADLASAFLDLDRKLDRAQAGVDACRALGSPQSAALSSDWGTVRDVCYAASAAYIDLSTLAEEAGTAEGLPLRASSVAQQIEDASHRIDDFYERHRQRLDKAIAGASAVVAAAQQALTDAYATRRRYEATEQNWLCYPSVQKAHETFEAYIADLQQARAHGDLAVVRRAVDELMRSAAALQSALDNAPQRAAQARNAVASIHTRIDAARTRAAGIAETMSALLRDFHADSSSDLLGNERHAQTGIDRASELAHQAAGEVTQGRPEAALDLVAQARAILAVSDELIDAVTDRLAMLRHIRQDPQQAERNVRFRLRDAQRLAVDRGAAGEWGSALDAQVARLDRIVGTLASRNPDYWRYYVQLQEVSDFIGSIVDRIRQRSAR